MIDPIRFKKILVTLLKILILVEILAAIIEGIEHGQWARLVFDASLAIAIYVGWGRIVSTVRDKKEVYRKKMESPSEEIKLWDAFVFSLLWTDEIYTDIPFDRKRLVVISYTLIAIGLTASFLRIGSGFMPFIVSGTLVLAAVNLLAWVVSRERTAKETLQTELKLAHDIQMSLMPNTPPSIEGFDIAGVSFPAEEVGGDHFDYVFLDPERTLFTISVFDVSGKGMHAAMSAVFTSGAFTSDVRQSDSPAEVLTSLNRAVFTHTQRGHFVAFLLTLINVKTKTLTFANAGQTQPILKSSSAVQWLEAAGITFPLGVMENHRYEEKTMKLVSGDVLLLLTDGFTEAMNEQKVPYGAERLEQFVRRMDASTLAARQIVERITNEIKTYVGLAPQHDDMTMVVMKVV